MFCYFTQNGSFDFVSNVMSNLSGLKDGREYMLANKMHSKIVEFLKGDQINKHRRTHLIETLRNLAFEYETQE